MLVRCVHHTLRAAARARPRRLATLSSSVRARTWLQHRSARMPAILARFASSSTDAAWTKHTTDDGKAYWHNSVTDESTWEDPFAEAPAPSEATDPDVIEKIYVGAFSDAVKYLKVISLTSCGFTLLAAPLLVVCGDESLSLATRIVVSTGAQIALTSAARFQRRAVCVGSVFVSHAHLRPNSLPGIAGAGIFSTALLNWVTSPYVIDMLLEDGHTVHLRTRTLLGELRGVHTQACVAIGTPARPWFRPSPHALRL